MTKFGVPRYDYQPEPEPTGKSEVQVRLTALGAMSRIIARTPKELVPHLVRLLDALEQTQARYEGDSTIPQLALELASDRLWEHGYDPKKDHSKPIPAAAELRTRLLDDLRLSDWYHYAYETIPRPLADWLRRQGNVYPDDVMQRRPYDEVTGIAPYRYVRCDARSCHNATFVHSRLYENADQHGNYKLPPALVCMIHGKAQPAEDDTCPPPPPDRLPLTAGICVVCPLHPDLVQTAFLRSRPIRGSVAVELYSDAIRQKVSDLCGGIPGVHFIGPNSEADAIEYLRRHFPSDPPTDPPSVNVAATKANTVP